MRTSHIPHAVTISSEGDLPVWGASTLERELQLERRKYRVATSKGMVLGFGGVMAVLDEAHITVIAVDISQRTRGVATLLLATLCEDARNLDCTGMTLEVRVDNRAAQGLYRKFGFTVEGVRPGYYEDGTDAVIMWHRDIASPASIRLHHRLGVFARQRFGTTAC